MEFELGRTYSGYKFLDVMRRSRTIVQYRVQNTIAQRIEALTTLPVSMGEDQEATERFVREARVRARLSHPNVVAFYTALPLEGRMVMTTELCEGVLLAERLELGPLPWGEAFQAAGQLLEALGALHEQGFVHCDITPETILYGPEGVCRIASFGAARPVGAAHAEAGSISGNPRYISPEQVKGAREIDGRADVYSVAVVLYEMMCGRPPFNSRSQFELMLAHVNETPAAPSAVNGSVPGLVDAVVLKGLAKEPGERYGSAPEFAAALAEIGAAHAEAAAATVVAEQPVIEAAAEPEVVVEAAAVEPVVEAVAEPEVVVEAAAVEPVIEAEPAVVEAAAVEPVIEAEPAVVEAAAVEPVVEAEPVVAEAAAVEPVVEAVAEPEVVVEAAASEPVVEAAAEPEVVAEAAVAEPVAEAEPVVVEAAAVEPVVEAAAVVVAAAAAPVVEAEPVVVEAAAAEPVVEAVAEPEVVAEAAAAEPVVEAEPVVAEAAAAEPVVEAEPVVAEAAAAPVVEAEPVVVEAAAAEPVVEAVAEPEVVAEAAMAEPVAEAVTEPEVVVEAAPEPVLEVVAAAPVAPQPEPELVGAAVATQSTNGDLQKNLWAAAAMVAEAASPSPAAYLPPVNGTAQTAVAELPAIAAPVVAPAPTPVKPAVEKPVEEMLPGFMARVQGGPDSMHWFVFGGTAAFLGVIWVAIWLVAGK